MVEFTPKLLDITKPSSLQQSLPQPSNIFTQIYLPYLWQFATLFLIVGAYKAYKCHWISLRTLILWLSSVQSVIGPPQDWVSVHLHLQIWVSIRPTNFDNLCVLVLVLYSAANLNPYLIVHNFCNYSLCEQSKK